MMRERLVVSVFLAILVHFILLLVLQLVLKIERTRIPEYTGPLYITLGETPDEAPDLIYSNAMLQWVSGHDTLFPRLVGNVRAAVELGFA